MIITTSTISAIFCKLTAVLLKCHEEKRSIMMETKSSDEH